MFGFYCIDVMSFCFFFFFFNDTATTEIYTLSLHDALPICVPTGANVASATCTPNTFPFVGNGTAILSCTVNFTAAVAAGGNSSFNLPAVPTAGGSSTNTASYDPSGGGPESTRLNSSHPVNSYAGLC